jgi:hypothetical protein
VAGIHEFIAILAEGRQLLLSLPHSSTGKCSERTNGRRSSDILPIQISTGELKNERSFVRPH